MVEVVDVDAEAAALVVDEAVVEDVDDMTCCRRLTERKLNYRCQCPGETIMETSYACGRDAMTRPGLARLPRDDPITDTNYCALAVR